MGKTVHITEAESRIMDALWQGDPLSAEALIAQVGTQEAWGAATVKTLINRLLKKAAIRSERAEGRVRYAAVVGRADYLQSESQGLLDRLFGGSLAPLVVHFAEHRRLKPEEVQRLRTLLDALGDDRPGQDPDPNPGEGQDGR